MESHNYAAFKNRCVTPPRDPKTRLPMTINERETEKGEPSSLSVAGKAVKKRDEMGEVYYCVEGIGVQTHRDSLLLRKTGKKSDKYQGQRSGDEERERNNQTLDISNTSTVFNPNNLSALLKDDGKFYSHLQALKMENKKTLKILDRLYNSYQSEDGMVAADGTFIPSQRKEAWSGKQIYDSIIENNVDEEEYINETTDRLKDFVFSADTLPQEKESEDESHENESEEDDSRYDYFQKWRERKSVPPRNILPEEDNAEGFRGRHSSYDVIDSMWETFSVEEYAPEIKSPDAVQHGKEEWKPKITIPKPFNMTVRESMNAEERAERRRKIENELMQKSLEEEAELQKKFKAQPLPASTYLPLYEQLKVQEEERREKIRYLSKKLLESKVKPFNFTKREEAMKANRQHEVDGKKLKRNKDSHMFKAQPYPEKLFNLSIDDKKAEQEEYRKIKMEMRSLELLASSSLPPNMKARGEKYTTKRREKLKKYLKQEKKEFKPVINHDIPDFEALQRRFERDMMTKRKEKAATVCEPFNLHTAKVPSRRSRTAATVEGQENDLNRQRSGSRESSRRSASMSMTHSEPVPYSLTESTRLRQNVVKKSLEAKAKEEETLKEKETQRKKREKKLRQQVARKSIANDLRSLMRTQSDEKMKEFRRSDAARQREYREQMQELKARLEDRPLLFEREAQLNAKRKAEKRYQQILLDAGVDVNIVNDLVAHNREQDRESLDASDEMEETGSLYDGDGEQTGYTYGSNQDQFEEAESNKGEENETVGTVSVHYNDSETEEVEVSIEDEYNA